MRLLGSGQCKLSRADKRTQLVSYSGNELRPIFTSLGDVSLRADTEVAICGPQDILDRLPYDLRKRAAGLLDALGRGAQEPGS